MAKHHNERCTVCNKFVTLADKLDDGMCLSCALKLDRLVDERTKSLTNVLWFLIIVVFIEFFVIMGFLTSNALAQERFVEEYYVTGVNLQTNERVVGWLDGVLGQPEVSGYVLDRGEHYVVTGVANGKGSFALRSLCCEYDVIVADEITNNKVANRKKWQESWK